MTKRHFKISILGILFFISFNKVFGNINIEDSIASNCNYYVFNSEKIDFKIKSSIEKNIFFQLREWKTDPLYVFKSKCNKQVPVEYTTSLFDLFNEAIKTQLTPKTTWDTVFIDVTYFRVQENYLPSLNLKFVAAFEFTNRENRILHSRTISSPYSSNIEKLLSKTFSTVIEEFLEDKLYTSDTPYIGENQLNTPKGILARGIYTSPKELMANSPNISLVSSLSTIVEEGLTQYYLDDLEKNEKIKKDWIYAFSASNFLFLNIDHYNPFQHFTKFERLDNNLFFGLDKIVDEVQAAQNTIAFGGGVLGASMGYSAATAKSCIIYDLDSGNIRSYSIKEIKNLIGEDKIRFTQFKKAMKNEDIKVLKSFMLELHNPSESTSSIK